jgi:hypothetical protein
MYCGFLRRLGDAKQTGSDTPLENGLYRVFSGRLTLE